MRRRNFIVVSGGVLVWPFVARAQPSGRQFRIGSIHQSGIQAPQHVAFYDEMRTLGFVEGKNLILDRSGYGLQPDQFSAHVLSFADFKPDVLLCGGDAAIRVARQAATTIPILTVTDDMVGAGFAQSLAKPGGNVTGISILATELDGKRQEILIESAPGLRHLAALADTSTTSKAQAGQLQALAKARGVEFSMHWVSRADEIDGAMNAVEAAQADALNVLATPLLFNNRRVIMDRALALRLPAIYQWPEIAEEGGFIAYGPRFSTVYRQAARLMAKIFAGATPAETPVEQPTLFELVVNLRTAKLIGRDIPASLVLRSDKVID